MSNEVSSPKAWNPRYVQYARAHGRDPQAMLDHDREAWPAGSMCGYIIWHSQRLELARKYHPNFFTVGGGLVDHVAYDAWLVEQVGRELL